MIKLAMIGTGMIVHDCFRFLPEIEGIHIQAIVSTPRSEQKAIDLCSQYNVPEHYTDMDEMLETSNIDTVYVGVPNNLHYEMCRKALLAGKNVICEKPFTSNDTEAANLIHLAKEKKLFLFEAVSTRYLPNVLKIKELLPQLGRIRVVLANYSQYSSRYDAFKEGTVLPAFDPAKSGGALMDLNIYNINLMTMLFGAPKSISYHANVERGIDTSGILTMEYPDFQAVCIGAKDCKAPILTSIQGDNGCIVIPSPANSVTGFQYLPNKGDRKQMSFTDEPLQDYNNGKHRMYYEFIEFVKMVENNDYAKAEESMDMSLLTMKIQTQARKEAGIVFPADQNYEIQ